MFFFNLLNQEEEEDTGIFTGEMAKIDIFFDAPN